MKKYICASFITILILLLVWNVVNSAEETKITYNDTMNEEESYQTDILHETDGKGIIVSEEDSIIEADTNVIMDDKTGEADLAGKEQELLDVFIEKVEYVYNYNLWFCGDPIFFAEEGYREKALQVYVYWRNGAYFFIPLIDCNAELEIGGVSRQVEYNELNEGHYIFRVLRQRSGIERDHGNWYLEYVPSVVPEAMNELTYLGMVEIDTSGKKKPDTMKLYENGYIDAIVDSIKNADALPVGKYKVYIGLYIYYDAADRITVSGVIRQDEIYRWFAGSAFRNEDGSYYASVYSTNGASERFPTTEEITSAHDDAMRVVEAERLVLDMEITEQEQSRAERNVASDQAEESPSNPETKMTEMTVEEAETKIEKLYNYYHWFYGSMPYDIESLLEEGQSYRLFTDGAGGIFWRKEDRSSGRYGGIYRSELQEDIVDLPLYSYTMESARGSEFREIGKMEWHKPELRKPELPPLVEDGYIREVEDYIKDDLSDKGKDGKYQVYFGRYEILGSDVRSISVAVTGEETFYLHCWVTKTSDEIYECFTVGGSYMGEKKTGMVKTDRIVQLERLKVQLEIN